MWIRNYELDCGKKSALAKIFFAGAFVFIKLQHRIKITNIR